jgi:hypothetical protein
MTPHNFDTTYIYYLLFQNLVDTYKNVVDSFVSEYFEDKIT